jgi:formamidopyrimidine-DNA glycosylase
MPELPEVETIRRHLAPHVEGRVLSELEVLDPRWCSPLAGEELAAAVRGRRVEALARRGKYLIWELEDDVHLMLHLRMTGTLLLDPPEPPRHRRVRFGFDDGREVVFDDPRRFGTGELALGGAARDEFFATRLGVEPFSPDFTSAHLYALTQISRAPIKAFLLDQRKLAGVGNIYADEALFRARVHPLRPAKRLTRAQAAALRDAVVASLEEGIAAKGASIDDFRHPDGVQGSFQERFLIHQREGEPCLVCGRPVRKLRAAGRGTYVCERCQPRPRRTTQAATRRSASRPARSAAASS